MNGSGYGGLKVNVITTSFPDYTDPFKLSQMKNLSSFYGNYIEYLENDFKINWFL